MRSLLRFSLLLLFCVISGWLSCPAGACAQSPAAPAAPGADAPAPKRTLEAVRLQTPIRLDADLSEPEWQRAPVASEFIELRPVPGRAERLKTEVHILYDDAALYVGAIMHDVAADSIFRELSKRDNLENTDFFGVFFDTYRDGLNGYGFFVTPAGVQLDARYSSGGDQGEDFSWNAVWDSRAAIRGTDWVVEMRIPYSAIRFPAAAVQEWGFNISRRRQSTRQQFFWNEIKPQVSGFINQAGRLTGLVDLRPPLRLSLTPYVSGYLNHYPYNEKDLRNTTTLVNGGADVKWGLNESFTLDATLVPDFGQVQSDNVVLNLTPFEVKYNENRPFFLEGVELFNKGNLFYSRRVGARPIGYYDVEDQLRTGERVLKNPGESRLLNATKLSGRTSSGLGVGIFNGLSRPMYATVADEAGAERKLNTAPLTNYNIVVLDQSLPHNSFATLINTNVLRNGGTYDANVTGGLLRLTDKTNTYAFNGRLAYSRRRGRFFQSEEEIDNRDGWAWRAEGGKVSGTWQYNMAAQVETDTYDCNDLGLLFNNNSINVGPNVSWNHYARLGPFNNFFVWGGGWYQSLYQPRRFQEAGMYTGFNTTVTKSFTTIEVNFDYAPMYKRDYFEPRQYPLGTYLLPVPASYGIVGFVSTDYRKKLALDLNLGYRDYAKAGRWDYDLTLTPRYRFSNQFSVRYSASLNQRNQQEGYFGDLDEETSDSLYTGRVLLGRRGLTTIANTLTATYIFSNRMSLSARGRHYTSTARYHAFFELLPGGERQDTDYARNRNVTFNAFNVDVVYSWWFAPGSEVSIVWKDAIATTRRADQATPLYFNNLEHTLNAPQNNALSVKVLYYLDWLTLRRRG